MPSPNTLAPLTTKTAGTTRLANPSIRDVFVVIGDAVGVQCVSVVESAGRVMSQLSGGEERSAVDWFFVPADDARARRPADVAIGVFGALLVLTTAIGSEQVGWLEDFIGRLVELLPSWLGTAFAVVYAIGLVYALIIIVWGWFSLHWLQRNDYL